MNPLPSNHQPSLTGSHATLQTLAPEAALLGLQGFLRVSRRPSPLQPPALAILPAEAATHRLSVLTASRATSTALCW